MTPDLTVMCEARTTVTYTGPLVHRCPYVDETDNGTVTITWSTDGATLELHTLAGWLRTWAAVTTSHETLTGVIRACIAGQSCIADVSVSTRWDTAGAEVVVRAVPGQRLESAGA